VFWATGIHPLIPSALRPKQNFFTRTNDKRDLEIRKARCTRTKLSLRSARLTQYIWLAPTVARPIFASILKIDKMEWRQTSDILKRCAKCMFSFWANALAQKEFNFCFFIYLYRGNKVFFLPTKGQKKIKLLLIWN